MEQILELLHEVEPDEATYKRITVSSSGVEVRSIWRYPELLAVHATKFPATLELRSVGHNVPGRSSVSTLTVSEVAVFQDVAELHW